MPRSPIRPRVRELPHEAALCLVRSRGLCLWRKRLGLQTQEFLGALAAQDQPFFGLAGRVAVELIRLPRPG